MHPIATSRLVIRLFTEADIDAVVRLHDECFGIAPCDTRRRWLEWCVRNYDALERLNQPPYGDYAITLKDGGAVLGSVGLVPSFGPFEKLPVFRSRLRDVPGGLLTPEMGLFWAVALAHRRAGYASEAAAAVAALAFGELRVARLVATTEHTNLASIGVMRRLGMTIERNPDTEPRWFQTVGVLFNPANPFRRTG